MKFLLPALSIMLTGFGYAQTSSFTVSYNHVPACHTQFTVKDTNGRVLGTGKSDGSGTFSCDCKPTSDFDLKADPDKGKGWTLRIPMDAIDHSAFSYDIEIERIEEMMQAGFDMQNDMLGDSEKRNSEMNRESGSSEGSEELGVIKGIVKVGQAAGDAQFKLIRASIGRSCSDVELKAKSSEKPATDKKAAKAVDSPLKKEEKAEEAMVSAPEKTAPKAEKGPSEKEQRKEAERLEKERKEAERLEQERIEAEEEAAAADLNFTPEEFGQMSNLDLNKKKAWCETAVGRNKLKLKTRSGLMKQDEIKAVETRITELENAIQAIEGELARREAEENARKAEKGK